jgi:hydroxymethylpyrimidine/phosphomethylpyrimidine kinase
MIPIVLTIAGSDSGGGAGIQADLKTFQAFGAFGTTAITAVTVQNTRGVTGVHPIPIEVVRAQIDAVAEDLPPAMECGYAPDHRAVVAWARERARPGDTVLVMGARDPELPALARAVAADLS